MDVAFPAAFVVVTELDVAAALFAVTVVVVVDESLDEETRFWLVAEVVPVVAVLSDPWPTEKYLQSSWAPRCATGI